MKKNEKEKQMLYEWGVKNCSDDIFEKMSDTKESYFCQRSDNPYIREYSFETFTEFMKEIELIWDKDDKMETIKKVIGVAAMKNKIISTDHEKQQVTIRPEQGEKLPEYIYNF